MGNSRAYLRVALVVAYDRQANELHVLKKSAAIFYVTEFDLQKSRHAMHLTPNPKPLTDIFQEFQVQVEAEGTRFV